MAERAEAFSMLHSIREWRESVTAAHPQLMAPLYHTLALLHTTVGEEDKVCPEHYYSINETFIIIISHAGYWLC